MGFFDFLVGAAKRKNIEVVPAKVWQTTDAKYAGLAKEVAERSKSESVAILLLAHFPDVLLCLEEIAGQRTTGVPVKAVLASNLTKDLAATLNMDESANLDIIVGEPHPLPSVDDGLQAFADELLCRCRFSYHLSLEDPVVQVFSGDWVKGVLSRLGMAEDESIESNMIQRRIRQAQRKIERMVASPVDAKSAGQWFELNCPELMRR